MKRAPTKNNINSKIGTTPVATERAATAAARSRSRSRSRSIPFAFASAFAATASASAIIIIIAILSPSAAASTAIATRSTTTAAFTFGAAIGPATAACRRRSAGRVGLAAPAAAIAAAAGRRAAGYISAGTAGGAAAGFGGGITSGIGNWLIPAPAFLTATPASAACRAGQHRSSCCCHTASAFAFGVGSAASSSRSVGGSNRSTLGRLWTLPLAAYSGSPRWTSAVPAVRSPATAVTAGARVRVTARARATSLLAATMSSTATNGSGSGSGNGDNNTGGVPLPPLPLPPPTLLARDASVTTSVLSLERDVVANTCNNDTDDGLDDDDDTKNNGGPMVEESFGGNEGDGEGNKGLLEEDEDDEDEDGEDDAAVQQDHFSSSALTSKSAVGVMPINDVPEMTTFGTRQVSSRTLAREAVARIGATRAAAIGDGGGGCCGRSSGTGGSGSGGSNHQHQHRHQHQHQHHQHHQTSVTIRLSSEEDHLFQTLVGAADMYEKNELNLEDAIADGTVFRSLGHDDRSVSDVARSVVVGNNGSNNDNSNNGNNNSNNKNGSVEIRVAGGWVRDKILDMHSHDVDIALNNMSGVQFAAIVQAYLTHLERTGQIVAPLKRHKIGVISANPSQSKHLETATMKIHGIEVDFVNLRAEEVYESHSRIPTHQTKQFGTPLEDALRRDFTCNSLFYNVRTRQVEDWTGRGIADLLVGRKIVTPLDPHITFHDDPLRVLRAIRFSVRYDMDLDDSIKSAARSPEVHHSLHLKVSRERVGKELEGMLTGKGARPGRALDLITQLKLAGSVFTFPPGADATVVGTLLGQEYTGSPSELAQIREHGWEEAAETIRLLPRVLESHNDELQMQKEKEAEEDLTCDSTVATDHAGNVSHTPIDRMLTSSSSEGAAQSSGPNLLHYHKQKSFSMASSVDMRLVHLSTFLLPFRNLVFPDKKKRTETIVNFMLKEGVKFKNRDCTAIHSMMANLDTMRSILVKIRQETVRSRQRGEEEEYPHLPKICRLETGMFLREVRELWVTCLLQATVAEMRDIELSEGKACPAGSTVDDALQAARDFYRAVQAEGLDSCWKARPLINGKEIISQLGVPKGPEVSTYINEQVQWMLLNPHGSKEDCELHLRNVKRKREMELGQLIDEQNELTLGVSDGGQSSPVMAGGEGKHLSKRRHVESMDLSECGLPKL
mmetsp:Transcript_15763/g.34111  ORF Transcript_15763/g.34111 Transcript_15763/m.34111 type:complete len:1183 (+) Transcript_15763:218-3766(+)